MYLKEAKPLEHCKVEFLLSNGDKYIVDFFSKNNISFHEFDKIREDKDIFYNEFEYDNWGVRWGTQIDVCIEELEFRGVKQ